MRPRALAADADEPVSALRGRADSPKVPGALAKAGVTFAFASAGLADPKDFVKNAAKAVKAQQDEGGGAAAANLTNPFPAGS